MRFTVQFVAYTSGPHRSLVGYFRGKINQAETTEGIAPCRLADARGIALTIGQRDVSCGTLGWLRRGIKRLHFVRHIFTRRSLRLLALSFHAALTLEGGLRSLPGLSLALFGLALPFQD